MTLNDLIDDVNKFLNIDLKAKGRHRDLVYAKKVYSRIASLMGYGPSDIGLYINAKHDIMIFHNNTFDQVRPKEIDAYNKIIVKRNLPLDTIGNIRLLKESPEMIRITNKLSKLSLKDLKYFEKNRLDKFLEALQREKHFNF